MNNLKELLRDADPLRHESERLLSQRTAVRRAVLAAADSNRAPASERPKRRTGVFALSALMVVAAVVLGAILWSPLTNNVLAAVQFEARLAESKPAPGLRKAKVPGTDRYVYLQNKVIVSNNDIAAVHVVQQGGPSQYAVSIKFNAAGAEKMRQATQNHVGKRLAILLDGQVIMTPVIRAPIGASAMITGKFTRIEAERIAQGIVKGIGTQ